MQQTMSYRNQGPGLWSLYGRALLPKPGGGADSSTPLPELSAELLGVATANASLDGYRKLCGFPVRTALPVTWPHILAFPLHLKLLTDKRFPLPLLGLVHLRNRITQHRPIGTAERLDLTVSLGNDQRTDKGLEFDLITQAHSAGVLVWEEASTTLFRQDNGGGKGQSAGRKPTLESYPKRLDVEAPESLGRRYGRLSGDMNPIHMHALSAKAFGFPRAIAHGMWSKAHCLALLAQQPGWSDTAVTIECQFKKPLFLPGRATLNWREGKQDWDFQLLNAAGDAPHLTGQVRWG